MPAPLTIRPIAATSAKTATRVSGVRPGDLGRIDQYGRGGALVPVPMADVYLIRSGELVATLKADEEGLFRLPLTLQPGIHTLVSIGTPLNGTQLGASVTGLSVLATADDALIDEVRGESQSEMRPVAFRRIVKQGPAFSVTQAPGTDVVSALGNDGPGPPGFIPPGGPGFGAPGGGLGGGAAGGGGGLGGGGLLIPALIGAGIGAAIAGDDDDDDDGNNGNNRNNGRGFGVGGTPPAATPARNNAPPFNGGVPVGP
ncbi:hypothetical protein [Alienimonas chondri]|nr:hypothetical protein [Alienimonas chondri]